MAALRFALFFALCAPLTSALLVGGGGIVQSTARVAARPQLSRTINMKSQEDIEFEEWAAKKRAAAGVDSTEDFGAGRRVESTIYAVGGFITIAVPVIAGIWAYNEGYLTPQ